MTEPWEKYKSKPWQKYGRGVLPMDEESSFGLGALKGAAKAPFNIGRALEWMGGDGEAQRYMSSPTRGGKYFDPSTTRLKTTEDILAKHIEEKKAQGIVPGPGGEFVGEMATVAPALATGPLAGGAMIGGMLTEERDPLGVAMDVGISALATKAGDKALGYLGQKAAPYINPQLAKLKDYGVKTTIGQQAGGLMKTVEDKLTSVPFLGHMIDKRRGESLDQWRRGVYDEVLKPIGKKLPQEVDDLGHAAFAQTKKIISDGYNKVLDGPNVRVKADNEFWTSIARTNTLAKGMRDPKNAKAIDDLINDRIIPSFSDAGQMTPRGWKELESFLSKEARSYKKSLTVDEQQYGNAVGELNTALRGMLSRSNVGTKVGTDIKNLNKSFANRARVKSAVEKDSALGEFTPQNLMVAARQQAGGDAYATGTALMQDAAKAGKRLGSTTPNSFTTDRALMGLALLSAGGAESLSDKELPYGTAAAIAIPSLLYTRGGQTALKGLFGRGMKDSIKKGLRIARKPGSLALGASVPPLVSNFQR